MTVDLSVHSFPGGSIDDDDKEWRLGYSVSHWHVGNGGSWMSGVQ